MRRSGFPPMNRNWADMTLEHRTARQRTILLAKSICRASGIRLASVSLCLLAQDTEMQICMKRKAAMMEKPLAELMGGCAYERILKAIY